MHGRGIFALAALLFFAATAPAAPQSADARLAESARVWLQAAGGAGDDARFRFSDRERRNWHFTPRGRQGLMIGDMDARQKQATSGLMRATLSAEGVLKATDIMRLEAVLAEIEGASLSYRNPEGYYVSLFGAPGEFPWGWRLEGHHLSINITVSAPGEIAATPLFTGTNPAFPPAGAEIARAVQQEEILRALRLIRSFTPEQAGAAKLGRSPWNIVAGPGRGNALKLREGIFGSVLSAAQRALLRQLIFAYIGMVEDDIGRTYRAHVEAGLGETAFAWVGEASERGAFYYRIHGPRILIEFDNTRGGNHIHAVWRDPMNDFGRDALKRHYADSPHSHDDWR